MLWEDNYLAHFGIKGQKWGIRRFQNEDGTLTGAGRERYGSGTGTGTGTAREAAKKYYSQLENGMAKGRAVLKKAEDRFNEAADHRVAREKAENRFNEMVHRLVSKQAKLSKDPKENIKNFDRLSKEDRKAASEEIFNKMDELVKNDRSGEAERLGEQISAKIASKLPSNVFSYDAKDPITQENRKLNDLQLRIKDRQSEIRSEIGYKETWYSSNDTPQETARKEKQEQKEWNRLMKAVAKDPKIQQLCREQKGSHQALINKIIDEAGLSDSETAKEWVDTLILGSQNYDYKTYSK